MSTEFNEIANALTRFEGQSRQFLRRRLGLGDHDIDDVHQRAFLRAAKSFDASRGEPKWAWIQKVIWSEAVDGHRAMQRSPTIVLDPHTFDISDTGEYYVRGDN